MKTKYRITVKDFLKANRKASREDEIAAHGKQIGKIMHFLSFGYKIHCELLPL